MKKIKIIQFMLLSLLMIFIITVYTTNTTHKEISKGKRFTYDDGIVLYEICKGYTGSIDNLYNGNDTDFRSFLLSK